jgi:cholesterol transport system auxiliary component
MTVANSPSPSTGEGRDGGERLLRRFAIACGSALALTLASCSFERPVSDVPTSYDFGPPASYTRTNPALPGTLLIAPVRAAPPLDDTGIVYRLLYQDGARPAVYAMSRWAAEPAVLMTDRLGSRFAAVAGAVVTPGYSARSDHTLRVELEDFSQHFQAPGTSRVVLRARATLLGSRRPLAQRVFELERSAPSNAPGAVKALTEAADAFVEELVTWTVESAKK